MKETGLARFAPLSGLAFILLMIAAFLTYGEEPPGTDEPVREIVAFWTDLDDSAYVGVALQGIASVALVFFGGALYRALRPSEGEVARLSLVAFAGSIVLATGFLVDGTVVLTLLDASDDLDPSAVQTLNAFFENDYLPMAAGTTILLLASGLQILSTGVLPKWLGIVAIALCVAAPTPIGYVAFLGGALWIAVVSVLLFIRGRGQAPATA